jgi:hypothetical protein
LNEQQGCYNLAMIDETTVPSNSEILEVLSKSVVTVSANAEVFKGNKPLANERYDGSLSSFKVACGNVTGHRAFRDFGVCSNVARVLDGMMDPAFFLKHKIGSAHSVVVFRKGTWLLHLVNTGFWHEAGVPDEVLYVDCHNVWCQPADGSSDGGGESKLDPTLPEAALAAAEVEVDTPGGPRACPEVTRYEHEARRAREDTLEEGDDEGKDNNGLFFSAAAAIALLAVIVWMTLQPEAAVLPPHAPNAP